MRAFSSSENFPGSAFSRFAEATLRRLALRKKIKSPVPRAIQVATEAGIHIAIISPFDDGRVILDRYELGKKAKDAGALSLESLTPDMADIKFRQAIAMHPGNPARIQEFLSVDIVGELLPGFEDAD